MEEDFFEDLEDELDDPRLIVRLEREIRKDERHVPKKLKLDPRNKHFKGKPKRGRPENGPKPGPF